MSGSGQAERDPSAAAVRGIVMAVIATVVFVVVAVRLWNVQIKQGGEFRDKSQHNFFQFKRLDHERGEIVDREGRVLVTNRPSVNVYVTPAFFPPAKRMVLQLGVAAGLDRAEAEQVSHALSKAVEEAGPALLLARDLSAEQAQTVREAQAELELSLEAIPIIEMPGLAGEARYAAYIDPDHFPSTGLVLRRLRTLMSLDDDDHSALKRRIRRATGLERYLEIIVRRDVPPEMEGPLSLDVQLGELPGVTVRRSVARHYAHGAMAAHALGYVNELSPRELEEKRDLGYRLGDTIGRRGVEATYEEELRGTDGRETIVVDSKGRAQGSSFAEILQQNVGVRELPRPGNRIALTIDLDLQLAAERAFSEHGIAGSVVMLDVHTGRILALTSTPSFDPNRLAGYFDPAEKRRLDEMMEMRPWRFRAIQDYFAPGSTFKVVTAIAALTNHVTTPTEKVRCPGAFYLGRTRFRCWKDAGHGQVDLQLSIARSCDVYYYTMGARMGLDAIASAGRQLGFGSVTGIPLSPESPGIMPTSAWYEKNLPEGYTLGAAVNASTGQGAVSVTPLQLAVAYAAIANGGTVYEPRIALRIESYDGKAVREVPPKVRRQVDAPPDVLALVREGLRQVVNEPFGTAYYRRLKTLPVSGKTGTAQVAKLGDKRIKAAQLPWKLRDHAWFAAFAPSDDPKVVVVVFNEHGGGGSSVAAPVAMSLIDVWNQKRLLHAAQIQSTELKIAVIEEHQPHPEVEWPAED